MSTLTATPGPIDVLIIGSGISGIGAAILLEAAGVDDVLIVEKGTEVGGTWRDNTYPGCACDVPSMLYSYSFAPNPDWSRVFAGQREIRAYVERVARDHGVLPRIRFGAEVVRVEWDASTHRWVVETTHGVYRARVLISGSGPWHAPKLPDVPGLDGFPGPVFHSSRWDHSVDLGGKRVAVVGTGASAVQFIPELQRTVSRLEGCQRPPQWVLPKPDVPLPRPFRRMIRRRPRLGAGLRSLQYSLLELLGVGFRHPAALRRIQRVGLLHLRRQVRDPALRATLTPNYTLGCTRLLMSNRYYPALAAPNVAVRPTGVARVEGNEVFGDDGEGRAVDAIVLATGFRILDSPIAGRVFAGGRSLEEQWDGSPSAYLGTTVHGFPNLFLLLGPSLGTGHNSAFAVLESQLGHVVPAVQRILASPGAALEVRAEVQDAYVADVQRALAGTVYAAGACASYFVDRNGRNSFSWPWSTNRMIAQVGQFDPAAYVQLDIPVDADLTLAGA